MSLEERSTVDYEFLFKATFEQSGVGMAHVDLDGNIIRLNSALSEMLGYDREELKDMSLDEVSHPDDIDEEEKLLSKLLDGEITDYSLRKRYVRKDLSVTWGHVSVDLIKDDEGNPEFLLGVVREIDEQVKAEQKSRRLSRIVEVQQAVAVSELNLEETMSEVASAALTVTGGDGAVVELAEGDSLVYRSVAGALQESLGLELPIEESISGLAYRNDELINCRDAETDDRVEMTEIAQDMGFRSGLLVPLSYKNQTFGLLKVISEQPYFFEANDESTLRLLSGLLSSQIYHAIQFEDVQLEAKTDDLTGLNNRRQLMNELQEELDRSSRYDHELSLMMIDLDRFKLINDSHGHVVGDEVLRQVGEILQEETRSVDILGRYGGEEFIVATPEVSPEGARELAERIRHRLSQTEFTDNEGNDFKVTCSIGLTSYDGSESVDDFIERADGALYEAKESGRDRTNVLEPSSH